MIVVTPTLSCREARWRPQLLNDAEQDDHHRGLLLDAALLNAIELVEQPRGVSFTFRSHSSFQSLMLTGLRSLVLQTVELDELRDGLLHNTLLAIELKEHRHALLHDALPLGAVLDEQSRAFLLNELLLLQSLQLQERKCCVNFEYTLLCVAAELDGHRLVLPLDALLQSSDTQQLHRRALRIDALLCESKPELSAPRPHRLRVPPS
jgi:hypothetical protein